MSFTARTRHVVTTMLLDPVGVAVRVRTLTVESGRHPLFDELAELQFSVFQNFRTRLGEMGETAALATADLHTRGILAVELGVVGVVYKREIILAEWTDDESGMSICLECVLNRFHL